MSEMHFSKDEVFICCADLEFDIKDPDGTDVLWWTFCPYCGAKLEGEKKK